MTSPLGDTTSWSVLMQLAGKVNGDKELTTDELKKLLEDADANNDGVIELAEFKEAFLSAEEYSNFVNAQADTATKKAKIVRA